MSKFNTFSVAALLAASALTAVPAVAQEPVEDEIVTVGTYIPDTKRATSEITSVLNEEIFETTGAGDIASALTRVTGLSLSQGKFVVVRGLNERYSSATLNGSPLPSPEPLRRVAPLDLFPTSVLSDVVVAKTFSPEMSGEFGGGAIDMKTKAVPDESFLELSLSAGANSTTTLKRGLTYGGSDTDWLGFDDGLRDFPDLTFDGTTATSGNFENFDTLIIDQKQNLPGDIGGRISAGHRIDRDNGMSIGLLATLGYSNGWEYRSGADNSTNIGTDSNGNPVIEILDEGRRRSTENKIALNGMVSAGVEIDSENTITLVGLGTRQSSAEARIVTGVDREDRVFRQDFTEWFEREVYMGQVLGEHYITSLNDAEVNWRAAYAVAGRDAPYERRVNYEDFGNGFQFQFNRPGTNNSIRFSELDDETMDFGADVTVPVDLGSKAVDLKFGGAYLDKSRDSIQSDFRYFGSLPVELRESRADIIFSDPVVDTGLLEIRRGGTTGFPDVSEAGLEVLGGYVGADVELSELIRVAVGGRLETSTQSTAVEQSTTGDRFDFEDLEGDFFMPAATATFTFADGWQLRLAASQTINRPQFRELTPSIFVNTDTDDRFVGNPFLTNSEAVNLDARLEYYFGAKQFVTVGGFYKDLTNPIEEFIFNGLGESNATSFINAPAAQLFGAEFEFEKRFALDDVINKGFFSGKDLVVRANYTYTDSSVDAKEGDLVSITPPSVNPGAGIDPLILPALGLYSDGRKLQGQSDHLANLQLGFEDADGAWNANFLLNYASERIRAVEDRSSGLPAIMEQLPISLDFVLNFNVDEYELGLKVQNLLDEPYEASQTLGDTTIIVDDYDVGINVSASIKRRF